MANSVALQADVGALGLRGLSAFSAILEACSADNVAPTAMIQMASLGDSFMTNGTHAAKVPDYLQRCSSVAIDRLALSIGWRKGDAASHMATSAGGQAISLLCLCIFSLYSAERCGKILLGLSHKLLPRNKVTSSVAQLVDVGNILKAKLQPLGFGNLLAEQTVRIHSVYEQLQINTPHNILELVSPESLTELLEKLSIALKEDQKLLRIKGNQGLGPVLAIVLMMFPQDTKVTVDELLVLEGPRKSIVIELTSRINSVPSFELESRLKPTLDSMVPIEILPSPEVPVPPYSFTWNNWVRHLLQLEFLQFGMLCPPAVIIKCCKVLQHLELNINPYASSNDTDIPGGLRHIFDPYSERFVVCCRNVVDVDLDFNDRDAGFREAYGDLARAGSDAFNDLECLCDECDYAAGFRFELRTNIQKLCQKRRAWSLIGNSLDFIFFSYFINCGSNVTIQRPRSQNFIPRLINKTLGTKTDYFYMKCESINRLIHQLLVDTHGLIASSSAATLFPKILHKLNLPQQGAAFLFDFLDGQIVFDSRYYRSVRSAQASRSKSDKGLRQFNTTMTPSSVGEHDDLTNTISEGYGYLELNTIVRYQGEEVKLNLEDIIVASYASQDTKPCDHSMNTPLDKEYEHRVLATSVIHPHVSKKKRSVMVSLVQTRHNMVAQLLACERGGIIFVLKDCCLNCALAEIPRYPENHHNGNYYHGSHVQLIC